jgi:ABC-type Fe3+/spermidine/putrescine transport system ATPase subunit
MAAGIELVGLTKRLHHGHAAAIDNIDLSVAGAVNLIEISVLERTAGSTATLKLGDSTLTTSGSVPAEVGATAQAVIRPERIRVEAHGSAGPSRVPAMVERVVYLGAATQVMLRLATGEVAAGGRAQRRVGGDVGAGHPGAVQPAG